MSWSTHLFYPEKTAADHRAEYAWRKQYKPEQIMLTNAKARAKKKGYDFDIELEDISIPELCPYLKVPLVPDTRFAPSLDRIDNSKGYVKGNVEVISRKANTMKADATTQELLEFAYEILERN